MRQRIPQKREVALAQKRRRHREEQEREQARRKQDQADRQRSQRHRLLDQASDALEHRNAIGGLHPRPLQHVVEGRVFETRQIELRRMIHNPQAGVAAIFVGDPRIQIIDPPPRHHPEGGEGELRGQQAEYRSARRRRSLRSGHHRVHNQLRHPQQRNRHDRRQRPQDHIRRHQKPARFPQKYQHRRYILQCLETVSPRLQVFTRGVGHRG